jgi:hypothetical protein
LFLNFQSDLQTLFDDLSQELKNPGLPTAICRHEKCLQIIPGDLLPARTAINLVIFWQCRTYFFKGKNLLVGHTTSPFVSNAQSYQQNFSFLKKN